ncbi:MAG TPA: regulatory iron-sulfur-containing complex subunit RicT [Candidatus Moranbacteria bacterium]|nr:regulatory iron-sulfur-containing complex subunit RicT [Candidatus Moranbacteria bacterium]
MVKLLVRVYSWESPKLYSSDLEIQKGEKVIVATDYSNELGVVEEEKVDTQEESVSKILRIATQRDREVFNDYENQKENMISSCKEMVKNLGLEMKVIDAKIGLDGKQIIFIFTADGRVDFRELVKNLSRDFKKTIRMQQIGSRDEARKLGGYGICGRSLCCVNFSGSIQSISTDMARVQQIAHRGTERISGLCGRLMCCLAYEAEQYKAMLHGMPEIYSVVGTPEGKGTVVEINAVTQEIKVKLESGKYITIKKENIK